ncbi:helix-turn-helix domain-containing protein [Flavivirga spongiicola]|uniref:Helix-turn-helix domain-containing protein n=1 Tax=Flavivirga spongiicola TaxID=421621 RepID=A0ABU7XUY7_9FLAO|nr:helix-turn-helix domain-containing protein [Flavivirga sp. MEBiC05379]MDO5978720.1 helix-turn-helix domain-containing protein [Flavivirga sp. MEBiC05379]
MNKLIFSLLLILPFTLSGCIDDTSQNHFSETVKVALRDAGHALLITNNDSTSLILPITKLNENTYELAFQNKLSITPDSLVNVISNSLKTANLPKQYIVEVINCNNDEVFYSFQIKGTTESNIVPCLGRNLPADCYTIQILFLEKNSRLTTKMYITLFILFTCILISGFFYLKKRKIKTPTGEVIPYSKIGDYKFYKDQNKLIKEAVEIKLSAKECELMSMLSANLNQVVKRETLVKEIWEDHGVFVDRSLDTFISKLRKKFKNDNTINIINVHGVGYKLEVL